MLQNNGVETSPSKQETPSLSFPFHRHIISLAKMRLQPNGTPNLAHNITTEAILAI